MRFSPFLSAAMLVLGMAGSALAAPDTVKIADGTLHGAVSGTVATFKGIPFAAPPVGDLRWRPPQPVKPWTGVREATAYGPACIQFGGGAGLPPAGQSEDCLSLNIWKPANAQPGAKLPVMFWIFGGAFRVGTGASPTFDGTALANRGVILVTINYRVGRLGYFAHPALSAEHPEEPKANYGVMDPLAALKWVQTNIPAFGGDKDNVTIFGQSAGGETVHILMSTPASKGLFAKAIAESGFPRHTGVPVKGVGEANGEDFARSRGVTGAGQEALKGLRALTVAQLTANAGGIDPPAAPGSPAAGNREPPLRQMIDGKLVVEDAQTAFAAGHEMKVPYIVGGNSYEASLNPNIAKNPEPVLVRAGAQRARLVALYGGDPGNAALDFTTESGMTEPTRFLAREHSKNGQKTWLYYASYLPASMRGEVHGLNHGGEIRYVFGNLSDKPEERGGRTIPAATPEDWAMSKAMQAYWVAFAKTGNPGAAGGVLWAPYDRKTDTLMEFGADGIKPRREFHKASLDILEQLANTAPPAN